MKGEGGLLLYAVVQLFLSMSEASDALIGLSKHYSYLNLCGKDSGF